MLQCEIKTNNITVTSVNIYTTLQQIKTEIKIDYDRATYKLLIFRHLKKANAAMFIESSRDLTHSKL